MTGFGRGEATDGVRTVTVELRAVNHRYAEFNIRTPRRYAFTEETVRKALREGIRRGKTDVSINVLSDAAEDAAVKVNLPAAAQYAEAFRQIREAAGLADEVRLDLIVAQPDVLQSATGSTDEEGVLKVVSEAVGSALTAFNAMRTAEGEKLAADILTHGAAVEKLVEIIEERAPLLPPIYAEKLRERLAELTGSLSGEKLDDRVALETSLFADKCNITEEIVRLKSHLAQLRQVLGKKDAEPCGKKLDFLMQEMNREANTIGSKANDLKITEQMLAMKNEIEIIREQVQNLE
jgi:uncharacterized protein (TIGR00255 family)